MKYKLRYYQTDAVNAIFDFLRKYKGVNPVAVLPTAAGKTLVILEICQQAVEKWGGRVLVVAHTKELLEQSYDKISSAIDDVGLYSASLNRRDTKNKVIVAGIQSVYKRAFELDKFDIILVDEVQLITTEESGRYTTFVEDSLKINPNVRVVGLTATPYRLKGGLICDPGNIMNKICYEVSIKELIGKGYLSKLISKRSIHEFNEDDLHTRMGDFIESELAEKLDVAEVIIEAVKEIVEYSADRKSCLLFCVNIAHSENVRDALRLADPNFISEMINGQTPKKEREKILLDFKDGKIKYLTNVNVLTVGFDAPNIDVVVMLRPTQSAGLYYQIVGRGFRIFDGKENCLVLDFVNNVERHGPVDCIEIKNRPKKGDTLSKMPVKVCGECQSIVPISTRTCPECGAEFPKESIAPHGTKGNMLSILASIESYEEKEFKIQDAVYSIHKKTNDDKTIEMLKIRYMISHELNFSIDSYICFEHTGRARSSAVDWWDEMTMGSCGDCPATTKEVIECIEGGMVLAPKSITTKKKPSERFYNITKYNLK